MIISINLQEANSSAWRHSWAMSRWCAAKTANNFNAAISHSFLGLMGIAVTENMSTTRRVSNGRQNDNA